MKIIASIAEHLLGQDTVEEALKALLSEIKSAFDDATESSDTYISTQYEDLEHTILGADEPEAILAEARGWNESIALELMRAMKEFISTNNPAMKTDVAALEGHSLELNTQITYALKKAAIAADNSWYDFAEMMVYFPNSFGYAYFHPLLTEADLGAITENPADYVILNVVVK